MTVISLLFLLGSCIVVSGHVIQRRGNPDDVRNYADQVEESRRMTERAMENDGAYQGDMLLDDDQLEIVRAVESDQELGKRKAVSDLSKRWPSAEIPYYVDADVESYYGTDIADAVANYEQNTCVDFVKQSTIPSSGGYVNIQSSTSGCSAKVGYNGKKRPLFLKLGSCRSAIPHELGHIIGFKHEHVRPDRDSYITVIWDNILEGYSSNFNIYTAINSYGVEYDITSVMHYSGTAFSTDPDTKATIKPNNPMDMVDMGKTDDPTFDDFKMVNLMYDCSSGCTVITCNNKGYQDKTCACVCPVGWTGSDCSTVESVPDSCKNTITSSSGEIISTNYPSNYPASHTCQWLLKGTSAGQTITVTFVDFELQDRAGNGNCKDDKVVVRTDDMYIAGDEYCGTTSPGTQVVTSSTAVPEMLIMLDTDSDGTVKKGFKFTYTIS